MFGPFRPTNALLGGLLWKIPWRLSRHQKARQRQRLRAVDSVVATVDQALAKKGMTMKSVDVWKETMPTEAEMLPKDKYTMFDRKEKRYRKGIHSRSLPFYVSMRDSLSGNEFGFLSMHGLRLCR
ncbi:mitochondrial 54S ribosomal protein YmL31 [Xylaria nigripes]|nr:mitochondrial 54S ribosomal protein YmL31 [Xylaria nigripes]